MKKTTIAITIIALSLTIAAEAQAGWTRGYYRPSDGGYTQPYRNTPPDGNPWNNRGCIEKGKCD